MAVKKAVLCCAVFSCLSCPGVFAEDVSLKDEINQLKARVQGLEDRLGEQDKCIKEQRRCILDQDRKIAEYESRLAQFDTDLHRQTGAPLSLAGGLEIGAGGTVVIQGTTNTNNATAGVNKKEGRTDVSYSADITIGRAFPDAGSRAFLHLEAGQGAGVEDNLTLYSNTNRDADNDNNVRLTEFWYEQALFRDKAALTIGKLDPTAYFDNNEAANDETTQFLGRIFRNSPVIEFPDNTAGLRLAYMPREWLELAYGVFDGNSDWEKIWDNFFNIGQLVLKTDFFNLPGNYRFLGWHNDVYHTNWLDSEKTKEANYGFGLSFDQEITDSVMLFTRYGWQDPEVYNPGIMAVGELNYSLTHSWSAGLQLAGGLWGREKDVFAFAVGQVIPSEDYKKAGEALDPVRRAKTEGHLETYYRIYVHDHLSLSPDFQYIWNPFGRDVAEDTDNIFVGGMRTQVDF